MTSDWFENELLILISLILTARVILHYLIEDDLNYYLNYHCYNLQTPPNTLLLPTPPPHPPNTIKEYFIVVIIVS